MVLPLKAIMGPKPRKDGKSVIYYQYCYSSTNRVLLSTDIAIPKAHWNAKRQSISRGLPKEMGDFEALNGELARIRRTIEAIIEHGKNTGEQNIGAYVKGTYKPDLAIESLPIAKANVPAKRTEPDFIKEIDSYIASKERQTCEKGLANFRSMRLRLATFEEYRKKKITFSSLDCNFYHELIEFLAYDYPHRRMRTPEHGLKTSTIGRTIKQLRMFIKDRVRRKIVPAIDMEDFKIVDEETDAIYLTYEEIGKMYSLDLSHDPVLAVHRDMFVLGSLTGLRFSDYSTLRGSDLRDGLLYKKTAKVDAWVVIPLRKEGIEIFNRLYAGGAPKVSNADFNKRIKEVAALAGISQPITFTYKKGNRDVVTTKPKSEWVTSHTCRRSFCSNEMLAGTDITLIMKASGHKTHREFLKYIRVSQEEAAHRMQAIWESRNNMSAFSLSKTV